MQKNNHRIIALFSLSMLVFSLLFPVAPVTAQDATSLSGAKVTNQLAVTLSTKATRAATMCIWGDITAAQSSGNALCIPYTTSYTAHLISGDGTKNIWVSFKTGSGTLLQTLSTQVILDTTPPAPPVFSIPAKTTVPNITLKLTTPSDADLISIKGDITNPTSWTSLQASFALTLSDGEGTKNITVQLKDRAGNVSSTSHSTLFETKTTPPPTVVPKPNPPVQNKNNNVNLNKNSAPLNVNQNAPETITNANQNNANMGDENLHASAGLDPTGDEDKDGLNNSEEEKLNTDAFDPDTDHDFLNDSAEVTKWHTDPLQRDTDSDGCLDGAETFGSTDPLDPMSATCQSPTNMNRNSSLTPGLEDSDHDGLSDTFERNIGTNPFAADSDNDGTSDSAEVLQYATNPLDSKDKPGTWPRLRIANWSDKQVMTDTNWFVQGTCPFESSINLYLHNSKTSEQIHLGQTNCTAEKLFVFSSQKAITDGYYLLSAASQDSATGKLEESRPIPIVVDKTKVLPSPNPEKLDEVTLNWAKSDRPTLEAKVTIINQKPYVYGKTSYGATVHATFESIITSSAIIADTTAGDFAIGSAEYLGVGDHTVYLYAVDADGHHSSSISIPFVIEAPANPVNMHNAAPRSEQNMLWYWSSIALCLMIIGGSAAYFLQKRTQKIPAANPDNASLTANESPSTGADDSDDIKMIKL